MLLFFESLPEISVNTELSFSSAMVFVWFFKRFVFGLFFCGTLRFSGYSG